MLLQNEKLTNHSNIQETISNCELWENVGNARSAEREARKVHNIVVQYMCSRIHYNVL